MSDAETNDILRDSILRTPPEESGEAREESSTDGQADDKWLAEHDKEEPKSGLGDEAFIPPVEESKEDKPDALSRQAQEREEDEGVRDEVRKGQEEEVDASDLEAALTALRLAGIPNEVIEHTGRKRLVAWGLEQRDREAKRKQDTEEKLKGKTAELEEQIQQLTEKRDLKSAEPTLDPDLEELIGTHAASIAAEYGDDFGKLFGSALSDVAKHLSKPAPVEQDAPDGRSVMVEEMILDRERAAIGERYPNVSDEDWGKVADKAQILIQTGSYKGLSGCDTAFQDAAQIVLGVPPDAKEAVEAKRAESRRRDRGQPVAGRVRSKSPKAMTQDEKEERALEMLEGGKSVAEVKHAMR